jgi:hypothetical protein
MESSGLFGSIRVNTGIPKNTRVETIQTDLPQPPPPETDKRENHFPGNRPHIIPMFQSKREATFWLILSLNMGGADLSAKDIVDEATRQADELENRNLAVWYRKRPYQTNNGKNPQDFRSPIQRPPSNID